MSVRLPSRPFNETAYILNKFLLKCFISLAKIIFSCENVNDSYVKIC